MKTLLKIALYSLALHAAIPAQAREVEGATIAEQAQVADQTLQLNGAGVRTKFVFDIYVGALYLPQKSTDIQTILDMAGAKRVSMHFLYDELDKAKLTDAWTDGFENNLGKEQFEAIKPRLAAFNELFITVKRGDEILLDYLPNQGTQLTINKEVRGVIAGADFYQALLKVWLGEEPADADLKTAMLGK